MPFTRLKDKVGRADHQGGPVVVDAGEVAPGAPWGARTDGVREVRHYGVRPRKENQDGDQRRDPWSGPMLVVAALVIAASAVGAGYVSYGSQKLFAIAHLAGADKGHHRAAIIAALPDAGWIAMALVGLVAALRGRSSFRARTGVLLFFGLSLAAQIMYAPKDPNGDWDVKALLVAVIAPIALAWMLESFIVEVRYWGALRYGLDLDETPILTAAARGLARGVRALARFPLWVVRLVLAPKETGTGVKDWFLDEAPLAPGRTRASMRADEAVARASDAEQIAAQAKAQAAELIEQAQKAAADQIAQARAEAAQQVEQIRAEAEQATRAAAEQAEKARREADERAAQALTQSGEQTAQTRAEAQQQVEQIRAEMAARLTELNREREAQLAQRDREAEGRLERMRTEAREQIERLTADKNELASQVDRLREELELLSGNTTAKARLRALYEQLGRDGDPRYLDRTKIRELAGELAPRAGMRSIGTADAYIRDYIATKTAGTGPVQGRRAAANGAMIVNGA
jgi:hypothetical protein